MTIPEAKQWFSTREAAAFSGKGYGAICRALNNGDLVGHRFGDHGHWHITRDDLDRWLKGLPPAIEPISRRRSS